MLTDAECRNATCPTDKKRVRLTDSGGLYLEVTPNGRKRWFWKYRYDNKEKRLSLGSYPAVHLDEVLGPLDAFRAQGVGSANHVDQVPAAVTALPFAGIGVEEVAIQAVARHLIVEAQAVVTHPAGTRLRQLGMYPGDEFGLTQALLGQPARGDAGDQARRRMGQDVLAGLAIEIDRLVDFVERVVSANPGHLQRTVVARIDASGFVVVPED